MEYVSLDEQTALASAKEDPHGFIESLANKPTVLDEFQYAPQLVKAIKLISDQLPLMNVGDSFLLVQPISSAPPRPRMHCRDIWPEWNCTHCL
jgi:hypothetical protein